MLYTKSATNNIKISTMEQIRKFMVIVLIGLLHMAIGPIKANAQTETGVYSVTVNTPGTFGQILLQTVENWSDVVELTVSGHLNDADMAFFNRMQNLTKLDVSNTDIKTIIGCSRLSSLNTVILPQSVTSIGNAAFALCVALTNISFDNIEEIGNYAFAYCAALPANIGGEKVKTIGNNAFKHCNNIESISFPAVESVGEYAFSENSKLKAVDIRNCETLGRHCFWGCGDMTEILLSDNLQTIPLSCFDGAGLQSIKLPSQLIKIGNSAFSNAKITYLVLPEGLREIDSYAFNDCPLEEMSIPSTVESIGDNAFDYSERSYNSSTGEYENHYALKNVYCKSVVPIVTSVFNNDMAKGAILHVPAFSVTAYKLDENWYKFNKIESIEGDLTDVTINNTFAITDYTGLAENVNLTLTSMSSQQIAGHLTVGGNEMLSLNNFIQCQNFEYDQDGYYDENDNWVYTYTYPYCTTLIGNNQIRANNITTRLTLPVGKWSFISMPYDVNVSDIIVPEGTLWVVRRYNGANRAAMSGETWENVTSGAILNAGEGYIVHCIKENGDSDDNTYVDFEFPAVNNSNKNNLFSYDNVEKILNEYPAEYSHNRGWNLIGNPYPSYLSSHSIDFPAPITVWNGEGYTAYSLVDDEYMLRPNEAFFVQCPLNTNLIQFMSEGRTHDYSSSAVSQNSPAKIQSSDDRAVLNFMLSGVDYTDRTRLVLNETAAYGYEIEKDASKFMSSNNQVPQIYIVDNGINYAINERPIGTGEYSLGIRIGKEGNYRIALNMDNTDYDVLLTDKETNETVNLADNTYSFDSPIQTSNDRFVVKVVAKDNPTLIDEVSTETVDFSVNGHQLIFNKNVPVVIYSIDGQIVFNGVTDAAVELSSGIYLLKVGNKTHKIVIK